MRLIVILTVVFVLFSQLAQAQYYERPWQVGLKLGAGNYLGDLVVPRWSPMQGLSLGAAVTVKYKIHDELFLSANLGYMGLRGDESNYDEREARSYRFESSLAEATLLAEYEFIRSRKSMNIVRRYEKNFSPYLFAGVGVAYTNPTPDFSSNTISSFQPSIDKFIDRDLKQLQPVFPFGIGLKYGDYRQGTFEWHLSWGLTATLTDLLDGISEQANPDKNDWYQQLAVAVMYKL